jgi:hypothetical protein
MSPGKSDFETEEKNRHRFPDGGLYYKGGERGGLALNGLGYRFHSPKECEFRTRAHLAQIFVY